MAPRLLTIVTVRLLVILAMQFLPIVPAAAQCPTKECNPALLVRRTLTAMRIDDRRAPAIDGRLDERVWSEAQVATDFVEGTPRPAAPAGLRSEARVLADTHAIYVALTYYDPQPSGIRGPLARRDDEVTSDWAFVEIDSHYDRRTAYSLGVNPRGVQVDGLWLSDTSYDTSWNAVWDSAARITPDGWTAEFRIPFSQLAFRLPTDDDGRGAGEMVWGINFYRYSPSHGQSSNWSPRYRGLGGIVSHFNDLRVPAPPRVRRLEVTPYIAPRAGNDASDGRRTSMNAGADLKVGLGPNFSLTGTLLPDFGQVEADPSQVNLTAFELFQTERRPFFLEGLDVFRFDTGRPFSSRGVSFAEESPFYSRRVGRAADPTDTSLLGAAKLSGQTARGWTLGLFTAFSDRTSPDRPSADDAAGIEPRSMITVGRALRTLNRGDSSIGFLVADMHRFDMDAALARTHVREATTAGVDVEHRFHGREYELRSWMLASRIGGDPDAIARVAEAPHHYFQAGAPNARSVRVGVERPDAPRLHDAPYGSSLTGAATETRLSRINGALRWDLVGRAVSPGFDVNEIGFQRSTDWLLASGTWKYERFRPGRLIRAWTIGSENTGLGWSWAGERRAAVLDGYTSIDWRNYWMLKVSATHEASALSIDRLRGGPALVLPPRDGLLLSVKTDQRKASTVTLDASASREPASSSHAYSLSPLMNVRSSDYLQWSIGPTWQMDAVGWQYVGSPTTNDIPSFIVGRVMQRTLAVTTRADVTFSPRLVLQFYAQPFGTVGRFDRYQRLIAPRAAAADQRFALLGSNQVQRDPTGTTLALDLDDDGRFESEVAAPDAQLRSMNASVVLRWEYRPGSFFTAVWNQRHDAISTDVTRSPGSAFAASIHDRGTNVLLLKISMRLGS